MADTVRAAEQQIRAAMGDTSNALVPGTMSETQHHGFAALETLLAALAASEQARQDAEKRADEWMTPFDGSGIEWHEKGIGWKYTYQASDFSKLVAAVHEYEVRSLRAEADLAAARRALDDLVSFHGGLRQCSTFGPDLVQMLVTREAHHAAVAHFAALASLPGEPPLGALARRELARRIEPGEPPPPSEPRGDMSTTRICDDGWACLAPDCPCEDSPARASGGGGERNR